MKVQFITAGPISWGSSRMRAYWPAQHMGAGVMPGSADQPFPDADVYIFQKAISAHAAKGLRESGAKVWWDVCDPSWWFEPDECAEIVQHIDGVVASSEPLLMNFMDWIADVDIDHEIQAHVIPDRLEMSHFAKTRKHQDVSPVRLIWYGVNVNRVALHAAFPTLERLAANGYDFSLTIMDNAPGMRVAGSRMYDIYYVPWQLERENDVLASHDIALLPPYPGAWGTVKSNNKTITAYANGLPVTEGIEYSELVTLMNWQTRRQAGVQGRRIAEQEYDVLQSARQWQEILS